MFKAHKFRNGLLASGLLLGGLAAVPVQAASTKDEIDRLQTQVQLLLDQVQRLQSTVDSKFGVLQHLVEQTADSANRMTAAVDGLQQKLSAQSEAMSGKLDTTSGQVQSLNDSVDELKSRMAKLDKGIQDLQGQLQNIQNPPQGGAGSQPGASGSQTPAMGPGPSGAGPGGMPAAAQAPPLQETYQAGLRDYNAAKYQVATGEFQDIITYYPRDDLAGNAQFYIGEIAYKQQDYSGAVKAYNAVLEGFSGSPKAAAAQLRKGFALIQMNKKEAGIHELRTLMQRHPQTPEATQARAKLNGMGVRILAH